MSTLKELDESQLIQEMRKRGFVVKKKANHIKHTFEVLPEVLQDFVKATEQRGLRIKEAVHQALTDWIKKR
jgi:DNA-binding transcriptional regulator YhcF (GntR family)